MRRLIAAEHISLDGVIQAPGGPDEDRSGGFQLGGWIVPYADPAIGQALMSLLDAPFELLLGRNTYDIWVPYWPNVPAGNPIADKFNGTAKHVATHRPESLTWSNSNALSGDLAAAVRALKEQDGPNLMTWGSGEMLRQLFAAGLVDQLWLLIYPVLLGSGKRLFDDGSHAATFDLSSSSSTPGGVLILTYDRKGEVRTGSFAGR